MPLAEVTLKNFTVFEDARFELAPGVNVLIGANATGKTHAMKAMYAALKAIADARKTSPSYLDKLRGVFLPEHDALSRLLQRPGIEGRAAELSFTLAEGAGFTIRIHELFSGAPVPTPVETPVSALYIPSREVLSMFEGFIAAYQNRELSFDETFYDLCVALSALPLRGERAQQASPLLEPLEQILGGKTVLEGARFYVQPGSGERFEAHLVAEGLRKIAALAHLVANGSLAQGSVLFWDEPETNLNPRLIAQLADVLVGFAQKGVQVVLATHDYLLSHRLSLLAEYGKVPADTIRFFGLARAGTEAPVRVSAGATLADLPENPILDEFARHYDFERSLFDASQGG